MTSDQLDNSKKEPVVCPTCDSKFRTLGGLQRHMRNSHQQKNFIKVAKRKIKGLWFDGIQQFKDWKCQIEAEDNAFFIIKSTRKITDGKKSYFICNRSGKSRIEVSEENRIRKVKWQGSRKIGGACTARFTVRFMKGGVVVTDFQRSHSGHEFDVIHLPNTPHQKNRNSYMIAKALSNASRGKLQNDSHERNVQIGVTDLHRNHSGHELDLVHSPVSQHQTEWNSSVENTCESELANESLHDLSNVAAVVEIGPDEVGTHQTATIHIESSPTLSVTDMKTKVSAMAQSVIRKCTSLKELCLVETFMEQLDFILETRAKYLNPQFPAEVISDDRKNIGNHNQSKVLR